ncbi:T9SS type A sorting domain-containing protein [Crocinitomix catalasitica]|nr:T9SS type A sorting domain-containing protein [Crocinitomix catalasitica]
MKCLFALVLIFAFTLSINGQTWSDDVAEIVYENCAGCHNPNGIGSVSFVDYDDAFANKSSISAYITANLMPPWTADTSFQHYFNERTLTTYERTTILDWVSSGAPEGDPASTPPPPVFTEKILPGVPDLTLQMDPYMSKATSVSDDYVCISIPTGLTVDRKLKALEVIPGNRPIVHHCVVFHDPDGNYMTDTLSGGCSGPDGGDESLLGVFAPGTQPTIYPANESAFWVSGMEIKAGSNIVLAMHYPEGSYGEWDDTKVNLYFYEEPIGSFFREVYGVPLISNDVFTISAGTIDTLNGSYGPLDDDYTFISAFPHMHLIGESIETYALDPDLDTIPMVRIPKWDFEWQDYYNFEYMLKVPQNSYIYGTSIYNNTTSNPNNPNDPPIDVSAGENTTDEMFVFFYGVMTYWPGDENFNVDSANAIFLSNADFREEPNNFSGIRVFPNPFEDQLTLNYTLNQDSYVGLYVYDGQGRIVKKLQKGNQTEGFQSLFWDGRDEHGNEVRVGLYFYSMMIDGQHYSGRLIKR